jgi:hypothetical protein
MRRGSRSAKGGFPFLGHFSKVQKKNEPPSHEGCTKRTKANYPVFFLVPCVPS